MASQSKGVSLHIGLNEVDPRHYAGWSGPLNACEADARDMGAIAKSKGFTAVKALMTKDATRAQVRSDIEAAATTLRSGDLFLLSYSGHGGQVPDTNDPEPDGMDETWCLYDGELIDDELYELFTQFRAGVRILVFSDSCHSGSVVRDAQFETVAASPELRAVFGVERTVRFRFMPRNVALRTFEQNREFYEGLAASVPNQKQSAENLKASVRLISGCQDNQLSADGTFNGLFTGTLRIVWNGGKFKRPYREFHAAIVDRMPALQTPNHFVIGPVNPGFDAEAPFTI
jgi:hypothetical protein